jgi:hypothetical protein
MPLPKGTPYPVDAKERLKAVLAGVFGGSRLALAKAAGVSRSLVNRWPPGSALLMDRHLLAAIENELELLEERRAVLIGAKYGIKDSIRRHNAEDAVRKEMGQ